MHANVQFPFQLAGAENLDASPAAVRQADRPQRCFIHPCAVFESVERFNAHWNIAGRVTRIVETALRHAPNQWHLAAFKTDADRAAGPRRLAFAAASTGLAVAAGFTLTESFATMSGAGTRFKIV